MIARCVKAAFCNVLPSLSTRSIWNANYEAKFAEAELAQKIQRLRSFDRSEISHTMTLIESSRPDDRAKTQQLLKRLIHRRSNQCDCETKQPKAICVGLCGSPGAGKSSLIEKLGLYICGQGMRLAVLAIDPSSRSTGGSLLGDKTRMERLAQHPNAFVRPSPTRGIMGGLALNTNELTLFCEHIGFDMILIETVGLGQNEIEIDNVADFVMYVLPPGSGDDLQGSKKGIMEIADMVAINKYDGHFEMACKKLKVDLDHALHFQVQRYEGWAPPVVLCSAAEGRYIDQLYLTINSFKKNRMADIMAKRKKQSISNMWAYISNIIMDALQEEDMTHPFQKCIEEAKQKLSHSGDYLPYEAASDVLKKIFNQNK